ncbi:efflux RND transporter permease subunit [Stieleria marina]|uniref:Membrane protein YdgH n=1 Tax=Stieleria marina TaxID=1930275 RepID=A0A517NWK2_9BACT|nr:Putative membrane protein YdgH [Planctomycetes bacterium K23_9]
MRNQFGFLADWIVDHRWVTCFLIVVVTVVTGIGHYDPYLLLPEPTAEVSQPNRQFGKTEDVKRPPPNVSPVQVASGDVIVVARSDSFFTPEGSEAIRDAVGAIESLQHVRSVLWMDEAPPMNIFGLAENSLPRRNATQARFDDAKERALQHPLIAGQLLSKDAKTMLLMVNIDWIFVTQDSDCTDALRDGATAAVAKYPSIDMSFQVTGDVPIRLSRVSSSRENERKFQMIGYAIALVVALILFRGLTPVLIVSLAPILGSFWTIGIFHYAGWTSNPFNTVVVPVLLCMVGFTDGVHMMVQIRKHRAAGLSPRDATRRSIREVGLACWLTSLTTAIGFGSLVLAKHETVHEFGYCCVVGVLTMFVAVVTVIPIACASRWGRNVHIGYGRNLVDQNLERVTGVIDFVLKHAVPVGWLAIVMTVAFSLFTMMLRPDERLTSNLAESSEPVQALAHIDKAFGGMESAAVQISFPDVASDSGEILTVVGEVERILGTEPLIGNPLSIHRLLSGLPGEGEPEDRMALLELLPPQLKRAYFTPEYHRAKVAFRLQDIGIAQYGPVFDRIEVQLDKVMKDHPLFQVQLTGNAVWRWKDLYQIVVDLALSLGTAIIVIFIVLAFVYRSVRIGLISVVPNLFPLAFTGFLLYVWGQNLEIVSVCAFTVCLGIAVDDSIHFLTRFREEDRGGVNRDAVIRKAFVGVGTALIMTTMILMIGFSTALFSDSRDFRIFAAMGILTIGSALFADLIFLPALLLRYAPPSLRGSSLVPPDADRSADSNLPPSDEPSS